MSIQYGDHTAHLSPYAPFVRQRVAQEMESWRTSVPADCLFFDQLGARRAARLQSASPTPLATTTDGSPRMAPTRTLLMSRTVGSTGRDFTGFHGGLLMMSRELDLPNTFFGVGNGSRTPRDWLFHDKVLRTARPHDGTMAVDGEVLMWEHWRSEWSARTAGRTAPGTILARPRR